MWNIRLRTDIWVSAFLRRCGHEGAFAAVLHRGDASAGAIFIEVLHARGADLYAPVSTDTGRCFAKVVDGSAADVSSRLKKERAFDPDLWIVSVDDRDGRSFLLADEYG